MRPLRDLMCSVIALSSVLLIPAISMAGAHSSWCVTGDPMSSSDTILDGEDAVQRAGLGLDSGHEERINRQVVGQSAEPFHLVMADNFFVAVQQPHGALLATGGASAT